ncbi:Cellulose synthase (UDP-forming) fragment, family GT2 [Chondrus crispus]|uniref:Cellulose synthase (UDP-forming), family GT2 n=1 Tax=Chondrus crispus TaxID=2769 RepID=R7QS72_CHOCR|nr:Cellulose synthase (UDP-forming) fragment, family GT2 [Chondrus crispus]CDF40366.1 Cellulose synthase (UDP-forming) fragment, family GT2 [Chondrus crispus]
MLQRLLPYFFVWDPVTALYHFDHRLAAVQAPQQFRNLSPHDPDPTDQRATFFFDAVLPAKDCFNAAPLVGTTNLINRAALHHADYFPYHSVTEDTALSIKLHSLGYKTYYVNEPLASGLATTSLWSNFDQRERWLKGDWQILLSKSGPLTCPNLSLVQRLLYLNMGYARLLSIVHLLYDFASVLLLVFGVSMVDVTDTFTFLAYLAPFLFLSIFVRWVRTQGAHGHSKSESGADAFETMFRFVSVKSLFVALYKGKAIKFKVTDKDDDGEDGHAHGKARNVPHRDVLKNLTRVWFNIAMACLLSFAIGYALASPPTHRGPMPQSNILPMAMALGFAAANLLPHLLAVYLCFIPLVSGWVMQDVVHGRCDQYAVDPTTGKRFVPSSFISLLNVVQACLIFGAMAALVAYTFRDSFARFIPFIPFR